jgi:hypothetical protein
MIFGVALLMHGLVALTETLILAMIVHTVYDLIAGFLIARQLPELQAETEAG